jgi:hypothetical protein
MLAYEPDNQVPESVAIASIARPSALPRHDTFGTTSAHAVDEPEHLTSPQTKDRGRIIDPQVAALNPL